MDSVNHYLEIHRCVGSARNPGARVVAGDAQTGVDAGAMRAELVMAGVALGVGHDVAPGAGPAAGGHEIIHAGGFGIRAIALLYRDAVGQAGLIADIERPALRIGARRRAGGAFDVGGKSIGITAVAVIDQGAESVAASRTLLAAVYRPRYDPVDVVLPAARAAVGSRHQLGDVEAQVRGAKAVHAGAVLVGDGEVHHRRAVDAHRGDIRCQRGRGGQRRHATSELRRRRGRFGCAAAARAAASASGPGQGQ